MANKKSLVNYYSVNFNNEQTDLINIRDKYSFDNFKMNSFIYTCLTDALEYSVRFGKKYKKKKDLLKELGKIEFQCNKALSKYLQIKYIKRYKETQANFVIKLYKKIKRKIIKPKQHFLIEVSKDTKKNEAVIQDFLDNNKWFSVTMQCLIKAILYFDYRNFDYWINEVRKDLEKIDD